MVVIQDIVSALWQHDFAALADPHVVSVVYFVMFATLFLENGLLPASFLPGDSLLLLAGALIAQDVMSFFTYHSYSDGRSQSGLLAKLHSGTLAGQHADGKRLAGAIT